MGANKNIIDLRKCGDILISQKTFKNKSKLYTFRCCFCSVDCDQLKKFSKHLEENHLIALENETSQPTEIQDNIENPLIIFEADGIKIEPQIDIDETDISKKCTIPFEGLTVHADPLDGSTCPKDKLLQESNIVGITAAAVVKGEEVTNEDGDSSNESGKMDYDDSFSNGSDSAKEDNQTSAIKSKKHFKESFNMVKALLYINILNYTKYFFPYY